MPLIILIVFISLVCADPFGYNGRDISDYSGSLGSVYGSNYGYPVNFPYGRQKYYPNDNDVYIRKTYGDRQLSTQFYNGMNNQMIGGPSIYESSGYYGNPYKPRFGVPELMNQQPIVLNGYPMYPKNTGYPSLMVTALPYGSYGSPTMYQGPTVSRLPFRASA